MVGLNGATRNQLGLRDPTPPLWNLRDLQNLLNSRRPETELPVLKIEVTDVKDRKAQFRDHVGESEPTPKKARITFIHAQCLLTVWQYGSGNQEKLIEQTKACTIQARTKESGERIANVSMDEPFYVKLEQLQQQGRQDSRKFIDQTYNTQITLLAANTSEPWPPFKLGQTPPPKVSEGMEAGGMVRLPLLVARWQKFPNCPEELSDSLLEAMAWQDKTTYKPKLSFKIKAAWGLPPSPLEICNASLRSKTIPPPNLPTPVSEVDPAKPLIRIRWIFEGDWEHIQKLEFAGYICPLCNGLKLGSMDEFHFHLIHSHDLFKFELKNIKLGRSSTGQQEISAEVLVDVNDVQRSRAANNVPDEREMHWVKPNTLVDLETYLKGQENSSKKGMRGVSHQNPSHLAEGSRASARDSPKIDILAPIESRRAEAVPDIPAPDRKRFPVPPAPDGLKFYRSVSKRPLLEGEEISESDDEIGESWLLQKHADVIRSFTDMSLTEKEFICRYDRHMLTENLSSHVHFREALIRFCRINRAWLRTPDMNAEFHSNLAKLLLQGVIQIHLVRDCEAVIQTNEKDPKRMDISDEDLDRPNAVPPLMDNTTSWSGSRSGSGGDNARSPTEPCHRYGTCICDERLHGMCNIIRCSNIVCTNLYLSPVA